MKEGRTSATSQLVDPRRSRYSPLPDGKTRTTLRLSIPDATPSSWCCCHRPFLQNKNRLTAVLLCKNRCGRESNPRISVLQTDALPLGHRTKKHLKLVTS